MYVSRTITYLTIMIVVLLYSVSIAAAQSTTKAEKIAVELPKPDSLEVPKPDIGIPGISKGEGETEKKELDENSTFDFSLPGDNKTQSLALFFERPFNFKHPSEESTMEFEGKFSGNYFLTFKKESIPPEESVWKALGKSFTGWEFLSRSYAYRLEGSTTSKFGAGGHIELERDVTIETDPHLHITFYGEYRPWGWAEIALGSWAEIQRLGRESLENGRFRSGLRTHCNAEFEFKYVNLSMLIEYLPSWRFKSYRLNASPEIEFKLNDMDIPFKKDKLSFSLVLMGEIAYYSENDDFTVEPLLEINPWEIRWTQLVRHTF